MADYRVGIGLDAHAFAEAAPLVLAGVQIAPTGGLVGHSDGDVVAHALIEAVLGAAGLAEMEAMFPSTDARLQGVSSLELLAVAYTEVRELGFVLENADAILIAEDLQIAPYRLEMRTRLAAALAADPAAVTVRSTAAYSHRSIGNPEGIAAQAVALLRR